MVATVEEDGFAGEGAEDDGALGRVAAAGKDEAFVVGAHADGDSITGVGVVEGSLDAGVHAAGFCDDQLCGGE